MARELTERRIDWYGVFFATLLTLVLIPLLYYALKRRQAAKTETGGG